MDTTQTPDIHIDHPGFSRFFEWLAGGVGRKTFTPLRRKTAGQARGVTLEVGAGGGYNFAFYDPERVEQVEAIEPDATMLGYARARAAQARVPITLTQAPAEALPFADDTFDTAVVTMVFCSVLDPQRSMREIMRVLKPGGRLLMSEHVRSDNGALAATQSALVPLTTRMSGNCHWDRDTASVVRGAGFAEVSVTPLAGGLHPIILVEARKG
ncbi:MAG: class I SAM-dependent methyltransferase [Chloroflexota bacterium]|nr:class I SAM-dependent methyltransferase [Chloroflexota bacterium]